jgi:formylglycine-generating enzyme required for sulfatase activity
VTVGQFRKFVEAEGYRTEGERDGNGGYGFNAAGDKFEQKPEYTWRNAGFPQTDDHPVVNVSWNDAVAFGEWLSRKEGTRYRLPTEAEWEYACRAGSTTRWYHGNDEDGLAQVGNVADATAKAKFPNVGTIGATDGYVFTAPVGRFQANGFGLYDMHGNVWEWCADWYDEKYYERSPSEDPAGPATGSFRVFRGGSWIDDAWGCRAAGRFGREPSIRYYYLGFRLARTVSSLPR